MELPARIAASSRSDADARSGARVRSGDLLTSLSSLLSTRRLIVFVLFASVFTMAAGAITDPDFWWHLRTGQLIFETRAVPHADPFSFTAHGAQWVAHEWLTEVLIYAIYRIAGWGGLAAAFALATAAAVGLSHLRALRRGAHPFVACAATLLGALAVAPVWGVRPQMISFLFASVFVFVLDDYMRGDQLTARAVRDSDYGADNHEGDRYHKRPDAARRRLWLLVPLALVWANMHGGFALGLALVALACAGVALDELLRRGENESRDARGHAEFENRDSARGRDEAKYSDAARGGDRRARAWGRVRPLCLVFAACAAVVAVNPNGARLYAYPFETLASHAMQRNIIEWFSPDFHQPYAHAFAALLFATFAVLALSPRRLRTSELLLLCVAAYASLRAWRNIPLFAVVALPPLAEHASLFIKERLRASRSPLRTENATMTRRLVMNVLLLVCAPLALCAARVAGVARAQSSVEAEKFPARAVEFLRGHEESERTFNEYGWGGYIIWKLYPERRVFVDGRADVYGDALFEKYLGAVGGGRGWRATLAEYDVRAVMVKPDAPLASLLADDAGWRKVYEDEQAVIFFKR